MSDFPVNRTTDASDHDAWWQDVGEDVEFTHSILDKLWKEITAHKAAVEATIEKPHRSKSKQRISLEESYKGRQAEPWASCAEELNSVLRTDLNFISQENGQLDKARCWDNQKIIITQIDYLKHECQRFLDGEQFPHGKIAIENLVNFAHKQGVALVLALGDKSPEIIDEELLTTHCVDTVMGIRTTDWGTESYDATRKLAACSVKLREITISFLKIFDKTQEEGPLLPPLPGTTPGKDGKSMEAEKLAKGRLTKCVNEAAAANSRKYAAFYELFFGDEEPSEGLMEEFFEEFSQYDLEAQEREVLNDAIHHVCGEEGWPLQFDGVKYIISIEGRSSGDGNRFRCIPAKGEKGKKMAPQRLPRFSVPVSG